MSTFASMKKKRMSFEDLQGKVETAVKGNGKKGQKDERFYYPETDENGTGMAIIRFLPGKDPEDVGFRSVYSHGFKDKGGWYIEECPTTIEGKCPACAANSEIVQSYGGWDSTPKDVKDSVIRERKRRHQFVTNILVIEDKKNPENEGKVFLFKMGVKIFGKIEDAMSPDEFGEKEPFNPFDMWDGANFKFKIRKVAKQTNYDASEFEDPSPIASTDKAIEAIWNQQYDLDEFHAPERFKSYEDLEKEFLRATGGASQARTSGRAGAGTSTPVTEAPEERSTPAPEMESTAEEAADSGDVDEAMDYFRQMAGG